MNEIETGNRFADTIDHLFRLESGRLVSVLTRIFGAHHIDLAEDVVQDSFKEAISHWTYKGIPDNPAAWIFKVAKNKAINILNREKYNRQYAAEAAHFLQSEWTAEPSLQHLFSEQEIADDQLRMIFTCCHPGISEDSQIALTLRTLCGLSIPDIARAFLTDNDNINKRLVRARKYIREHRVAFEVPTGIELEKRQNAVLETMYLMFNEGYSTLEGDDIVRSDLCKEAIRLTGLMATHPKIRHKNNVYGLLSLMLLNTSRFSARQSDGGSIINLADQDRTLWDRKMIEEGLGYLYKAFESENDNISKYQIMAAISAHHCTAESDDTTDWKDILSLYDNLMQIDPSAVVLLNRAVAVSKVYDAQKAIDELEKLKNETVFKNYPYYFSVLGEFYTMTGRNSKAADYFRRALTRTRNRNEIAFFKERIRVIQERDEK